jgi:hypothetical protein
MTAGLGTGIPPTVGSFISAGSLAINKVVKFSASKTVVLSSAATDKSIGVTDGSASAAAQAVPVCVGGEHDVIAGGSISAGDFLVPDSAGDVVAVTLGTTTVNIAIGRALEDAVDNDIFKAAIFPGGQYIQV